MITLDAIRTAISTPDPYNQLDHLIRAEMVAGRKIKEIIDAIKPLVDMVLDTPGLSEDGEEAFLGTLDALTGNCHRDWCYYDPPTLPTEEEVAKLPRWAVVAFASRCARRVLLLFTAQWPSASEKDIRAVTRAVEVAEQTAVAGFADSEAAAITETVAGIATSFESSHFGPSAAAAAAAAEKAATAAAVFESSHFGSSTAAAAAAEKAATAVATAIARDPETATANNHIAIAAIRSDFERLIATCTNEGWTDSTPVPLEVFGPLWPEGAPHGWPTDPNTPTREELALGYLTKEGVLDRILVDEIVNLFNAMNRYHIARCGVRLTLEGDIFTLLTALVPAGGVR